MIVLGETDRRALEAVVRRGRAEHRQVLRAWIVPAAADGDPNAVTARRLAVTEDTVRKWRKRFCRVWPIGLAADVHESSQPR